MKQFSAKELQDIKNCLQEISNSLTRVEAERDNIKDIVNRMAEEFELNKRVSRRLARAFHKRNIEEERAEQAEVNDLYDNVVK